MRFAKGVDQVFYRYSDKRLQPATLESRFFGVARPLTGRPAKWGDAFHRMLVQITGNPILSGFLNFL
ncbi:FCD domain-containing protein [Boseongicola sp. H5]|uniref:FCD domain-containing protein n=1 Tax=Boseongicola sp. H5 TaxID=2763261 RepID=UPI001D0AE394|nr:FCD domain-containing protein [Boseongicola sp. H5]